jgi:uncharacterized protein (DUF58 family)
MPTARGWACIAASGAVLGAGAALRIAELLEIGVVLLALVLLQLARTRLAGRDFVTTRAIHPPKAMAGSPLTVDVTVASSRRSGRGIPDGLFYTDPVPPSLGGPQRMPLVADGPAPATVRYRLTPRRRGRYAIGPGLLTATDPFGLVRASEATGSTSGFVVFPRVEPLRGRAPAGIRHGGTSRAATASLASGSEFFATREWRPGDDMRRIHWRSTARMGTVMVRQEELPRRDRATVVLDNRRSSYAPGWDGEEIFERAVEAAASLVHHFLGDGFTVRLAATAGGGNVPFGKGPGHHTLLMTALATATLAGGRSFPGRGAGLMVVVGGFPEAADGGRLVSLLDGTDALVVITSREEPDTRALARARVPVLHVPPGRTLAEAWHR